MEASVNLTYLMKYLSAKLNTIIRRCPVSGDTPELICQRRDLQDGLGETESFLICHTDQKFPTVFLASDCTAYAGVSILDSVFLVGPVLLENSAECVHELPDFPRPDGWPDLLHRCSLSEFTELLLLLRNLFSAEPVSLEDTLRFNCIGEDVYFRLQQSFSDIVFHAQEASALHNPYDQELREMDSISRGDLQKLQESWEEVYPGKIGTMAKDPLRHSRNHGIVLVTIACRAAIRGGLLPEMAFSLSDTYIQKIEEAASPETAVQLGRQAEYQYTLLVQELQKKKRSPAAVPSSRISACKDYIFAHLHEKISISSIADALFLNKNYLCDLFKKEEGMTIGDYILQQKISLVQNMLLYSPCSCSEIAAYFGFSSQSHLGKQFKKVTGMTLGQYRDTYGRK